jgi:hypothetical protein
VTTWLDHLMHFPWTTARRQRETVESMLKNAQKDRREAEFLLFEAELLARQSGARSRQNHLPEAIAALMPHKPHKGET